MSIRTEEISRAFPLFQFVSIFVLLIGVLILLSAVSVHAFGERLCYQTPWCTSQWHPSQCTCDPCLEGEVLDDYPSGRQGILSDCGGCGTGENCFIGCVATCIDDNTEPECYEDSDCGEEYVRSTYCHEGNVLEEYRNWNCVYPGQGTAYCEWEWDTRETVCQANEVCVEDDDDAWCEACTRESYKDCYDDDVYWYDSCGNRENKIWECGSGFCEDAECQAYRGYICDYYHTELYFSGSLFKTCTNNCVWHGPSHNWQKAYCSEDTVELTPDECSSEFETCDDSDTIRRCYYDSDYNVQRWKEETEECESGDVCVESEGNAQCEEDTNPCDSHEYYKCYDNHLYWYDSCNSREEMYKQCLFGCTKDECEEEEVVFYDPHRKQIDIRNLSHTSPNQGTVLLEYTPDEEEVRYKIPPDSLSLPYRTGVITIKVVDLQSGLPISGAEVYSREQVPAVYNCYDPWMYLPYNTNWAVEAVLDQIIEEGMKYLFELEGIYYKGATIALHSVNKHIQCNYGNTRDIPRGKTDKNGIIRLSVMLDGRTQQIYTAKYSHNGREDTSGEFSIKMDTTRVNEYPDEYHLLIKLPVNIYLSQRVTTFSDGSDEKVIALPGNGSSAQGSPQLSSSDSEPLGISVPQGSSVYSMEMTIEGDGDNPPEDVLLDVGADGDVQWVFPDQFNITTETPDYSQEIQEAIDNCTENECDVPLVFSAGSGGQITVKNPKVYYYLDDEHFPLLKITYPTTNKYREKQIPLEWDIFSGYPTEEGGGISLKENVSNMNATINGREVIFNDQRVFNDSSTSATLSFDGGENRTVWISLPKDAVVLNAGFSLLETDDNVINKMLNQNSYRDPTVNMLIGDNLLGTYFTNDLYEGSYHSFTKKEFDAQPITRWFSYIENNNDYEIQYRVRFEGKAWGEIGGDKTESTYPLLQPHTSGEFYTRIDKSHDWDDIQQLWIIGAKERDINLDVSVINEYLSSCIPENGVCNVPITVHANTRKTVNLREPMFELAPHERIQIYADVGNNNLSFCVTLDSGETRCDEVEFTVKSDVIIGDANDDGEIGLIDLVMVAIKYGTSRGHDNWNPFVDMNNDGKISIADLAIVGKALCSGYTCVIG